MRRWLVLGSVIALLGVGCGTDTSSGDGAGKVGVVAAFYPVAEAAQRVGGSCVSVQNLTPAGAEPHDLELTPDQVDAIQDATVVFVMGHGFQPGVEDAADQRDGPTVKLLDGLRARKSDPHVWLDPTRYSELVNTVSRALVRAAPECRAQIRRNAATFRTKINGVGDEYAAELQTCDRRTIVTAHEAFGYLADRYHLDQQGIAGISPDEEPNAQRLGDLADLVQRDGITTIFTEELVSRRVADALAREAGGVRTETLSPIEGLTDEQVAHGADWASEMRENLTKLRNALGCR
jgi:zinc transport system substrate-binding protein